VADPDWYDPLDPSHARREGGRWNPPGGFDTLYLNGDVATARLQIERLLAGSPLQPDDLDENAYVLVAATLPRSQICADAVTPGGLRGLGLPESYPASESGGTVQREVCQQVGSGVQAAGLRGVWSRSAARREGEGRELAWFPATTRSRTRPLWKEPLPYGRWRVAEGWNDLGLDEQSEPGPAGRESG
jgi:hypothetical protein